MIRFGAGLTQVATADLKKALRAVHRGELACPPTVESLAVAGLQHAAEPLLHHLRGLDERAVRAVLTAVLAERGPG